MNINGIEIETIEWDGRFAEFFWNEALKLRDKLASDTYVVNGVFHWNSNDAVVPPSTFKDAYLVATEAQVAARKIEVDAVIKDYIANYQGPSEEERFEMRAAFGEGETIVNVFTGTTVTT